MIRPGPETTARWLIIIGFVTTLWLPILQRPLRYLACFYQSGPDGLHALGSYECEKRFLDRFPRRGLLAIHDRLRSGLFELLPRTVIQGSDGWLFYRSEAASDGDSMDDFQGHGTPSSAIIAHWQKALTRRRSFCDGLGAVYLAVVAPNKQSIYPEFLPPFAQRHGGSPPCRLDLLARSGKFAEEFGFLDLRESLSHAKQREPVYHRTDTHWNAAGALAADSAIVSWLSARFPGLSPLPRAAFSVRTRVQSGDIAVMAHAADQFVEPMACLVPSRDFSALGPGGRRLLAADSDYVPPSPELRGGVDVVVSENPEAPDVRALVFHDSFGLSLMPFLAQHFRHTTFVRRRFASQTVIDEHPQVVIDIAAERYIDRLFAETDQPAPSGR